MRTLVVVSLTVLMLAGAASASANGWRALRIDGSTASGFEQSVAEMRQNLPYNRGVLFDLVLEDLKARFATADVRKQVDGLGYKEIIQLASPAVVAKYEKLYARLREKDARDSTGLTTEFQGFSE